MVPLTDIALDPSQSLVASPSSHDLEMQEQPEKPEEKSSFSKFFYTSMDKCQDMRYGENPHQKAALYLDPKAGR